MPDSLDRLTRLTRPRLLMRAARAGAASYDRERDLARILRGPRPDAPGQALDALLDWEAEFDGMRRDADPGYDIARHVELLIAALAEARLIQPRPEAITSPTLTAAR